MSRPLGVTAISMLFFTAAGYLAVLATLMLASPGLVSMRLGAPLLHGLELAGPYMFLIVAAVLAAIGWGMWRVHRWARRLAMVVLGIGVVLLIPAVSAASVTFGWRVLWYGLQIAVRAAAAWYLAQSFAVIEAFGKKQ